MSNKEKLEQVYNALGAVFVAGNGNIKTMAGVFAILEDVLADMDKVEGGNETHE